MITIGMIDRLSHCEQLMKVPRMFGMIGLKLGLAQYVSFISYMYHATGCCLGPSDSVYAVL
jgi:hypothetical protein